MKKILLLYYNLRKKYGDPKGQWILWCKRPKTKQEREEIIMGAVLTQRTNWKNVALALRNLNNVSLKEIYELGKKDMEKLRELIKPSGFYKTKARYLLEMAKFFTENENVNRKSLLALPGVGPETADSILLYALDKPVFVIDEYTRRLAKKEQLTDDLSYENLQKLFESNLPKDYKLYQDFHALIVIDGQAKS